MYYCSYFSVDPATSGAALAYLSSSNNNNPSSSSRGPDEAAHPYDIPDYCSGTDTDTASDAGQSVDSDPDLRGLTAQEHA